MTEEEFFALPLVSYEENIKVKVSSNIEKSAIKFGGAVEMYKMSKHSLPDQTYSYCRKNNFENAVVIRYDSRRTYVFHRDDIILQNFNVDEDTYDDDKHSPKKFNIEDLTKEKFFS